MSGRWLKMVVMTHEVLIPMICPQDSFEAPRFARDFGRGLRRSPRRGKTRRVGDPDRRPLNAPTKWKEHGYRAALFLYLPAYFQNISLKGAIVTWLEELFLEWNEWVEEKCGDLGA